MSRERSEQYEVDMLPRAEKDIRDLKQHAGHAIREILKLENDPLLGHELKGSLQGARALEFNLKCGGVYRAIYTVVDEDRVCIVFLVGPHENIYKKAERRYAALKRSER